jgi:uncharacterized protein GlcG (DUF336 family)
MKKTYNNRHDFLEFAFSTHYTLKAKQACGCYWIKKHGKIIADIGIAGNSVSIDFRK